MNRFRRLTIAVSLSLALVSVPAMALATTDVTYAISGVEYAATTTVGSFAGVAVTVPAGDYGTWQATIFHDTLPTTTPPPNPTAKITGGSFTLDGKVRDLAGTITSGSITQTEGFTGCGRQTYNVVGTLTPAAGTITAFVTASFGAVLTHYRIWLWWVRQCKTYAATVKGSVTFTLP